LVELIDPAFRRVLARIFGRDATVRRNRGRRGGGSLRQRGQSGEGQRGNQGDQKQTWIHRSSLGERERGPILSPPAAPGKPDKRGRWAEGSRTEGEIAKISG